MSDNNDDNYKKEKNNKNWHEAEDFDNKRFKDEEGKPIVPFVNEERKCTDLFCCILFFAFVCVMGYLTKYGLTHGNVEKLLAPLDGDDNFCGVSVGYEDYKLLYLTSLSGSSAKSVFANGVCIKGTECPKDDASQPIECKTTSNVPSCEMSTRYNTKKVLSYCFPASTDELPDNFKTGWELAKQSFLANPVGKYFNDMYLSSRAIYGSMGMALVYTLIYIKILSMFAEPIAWICIVAVNIGLFALSAGAWFMRVNKNAIFEATQADMTQDQRESAQKEMKLQLAVCIIGAILGCCFFLCVCCYFSSLKLAIDVIDASADFLNATKRIVLVPVLYFFLIMIVFLVWLAAMTCVASMNKINADTGTIPQAKDLIWEDPKIKYMAWFMFFGLLWIVAWLKYTNQFIVIVSASTYYFNSDPSKPKDDQEGEADVGKAFHFAYMYHCGSIAMGSFIIAVVQLIRFIFYYIAKQAEKASGDNQAVKCIIACGACYLKCIEKIVDYIQVAGFCYVAVSGDSFCSSCWSGFLLNVKHMAKFAFANFLAKIFMTLGKVALCVGNTFSLLFIMKNITKDMEEITSVIGPVVVVCVVTYLTASLFLGMFDTAVMAILTCLALDMDIHNSEDPTFGPPTFHENYKKMKANIDGKKVEPEVAAQDTTNNMA